MADQEGGFTLEEIHKQIKHFNTVHSGEKEMLVATGYVGRLLRTALELEQKLELLREGHLQMHIPTADRVREAHTSMNMEAMKDHSGAGHRVYAQSVDEECYLYALLVLLDTAKKRIAALKREYHEANKALADRVLVLAGQRDALLPAAEFGLANSKRDFECMSDNPGAESFVSIGGRGEKIQLLGSSIKPPARPWRRRKGVGVIDNALQEIRSLGWSVAVHNDYMLAGIRMTFWLFTKGDYCAKGEAQNDVIALVKVLKEIARIEEERTP